MISLPQLHRIKIRTHFEEIEVQIIKISSKARRNVLVFDHLISASCVLKLRESILASQVYALIYEIPEKVPEKNLFNHLQDCLKNEKNEYEVGVLHEPFNNFADIFLIVHKEQRLFNENIFKGSKIAIFEFSYKRLLGADLENYSSYLSEVLISNHLVSQQIQDINNEIKSLQTSIETINSHISNLCDKNLKSQSSVVTARKLVRNLSEEIQGNSERNKLDCESCKQEKKSIVFLPCGDIVSCKNCIKFQFKIPINTLIKKNTFKCPKCSLTIFEAKEVYF